VASKKPRIRIPDDIVAELYYISDRTCCVCTEKGKPTQIHHIDENPSNNIIENLAILCLGCHNDTQVKGGFGRKLNSAQVIKHKTEWFARVKERRDQEDKIISSNTLEKILESLNPQRSVYKKRENVSTDIDSLEMKFKEFMEKKIDPIIKPFSNQRIAWGKSLTLLQVPEISEGWPANEVKFNFKNDFFNLPLADQENFAAFYTKNEVSFKHDGIKYMLKKKPVSFTDAPSLTLDVQSCKFSQIQYYRNEIVPQSNEQNDLMEKTFLKNIITFPHSLCLHLVVITADEKILLTKRSKEVSYYPEHWSASLEEQLHEKDFLDNSNSVLSSCLKRLFEEEVGLAENKYTPNALKILSVFVEADIMSISLCGSIRLNIGASELTNIINFMPRKDNEFNEFELMSFDDIIKELKFSPRKLHPSAGYRLLITLYNILGTYTVIEKLIANK
jgi:isopentenyldiphosphate isomerase